LSPHHLFLAIILLQSGFVAFAAWANPLTDWDAWVNWASKANAILIDQTLSPNMFHNPACLPTNMERIGGISAVFGFRQRMF
jgi:hypothetical protein